MLTKLTIKNFKKLEYAEFELDRSVVFVGPNNSGKTTALQAISLWELGLRQWAQQIHKPTSMATINRYDIYATPVPSVRQLWKDLKVENHVIEIIATGFSSGKNWRIGFQFIYANPESINCRLISEMDLDIFQNGLLEQVGFLPPLSGLAAVEDKLPIGSIRARIGEGRTAEVLRNLCWLVYEQNRWQELAQLIQDLFQVKIDPPEFNELTGRLTVTYQEINQQQSMDLANTGRGFQQILFIFSYLFFQKNTILLVDEPDAHLEILRQKEIYHRLSALVKSQQSQLIMATHSEAILNEAASTDKIIAFLGTPHLVNSKRQIVKALTTIGFDQYLLAAQKKRIIYLEGSTDFLMLKAWAKVLNHPLLSYLTDNPFVKYVANNPLDARNHFYGLKEAVPDLKGVALYDRLDRKLQSTDLQEFMWQRREIENYLPIPSVVERYIEKQGGDISLIRELMSDYMPPIAKKDRTESWWFDTKMSDEFLDKIFRKYFQRQKQPVSLLSKSNYYELALLSEPDELDGEILEKLEALFLMFQAIQS
jgi:ABC-type molybdenum transport system ATPase subunit/photorepair protein PhrA